MSHNVTYKNKLGFEKSVIDKNLIIENHFLFALVFNLAPQGYYRLVDKHSSLHKDFVQEIDKGLSANFSQVDIRVTPEMYRAIDEIGAFKFWYLGCKKPTGCINFMLNFSL